mgnify:CR=1 FL=1
MMIQDKFISLEGKVAIITGAGQGIGLAIAQLYAKYGAAVAMVDVSDKCAEEAGKIRELGAEAQAFKCDVTSEDDVKKTVEAVMKAFGHIDILVNNAGIIVRKTVLDTTVEEWDRCMDIGLKGTFLFSKHVVPIMIKEGGGVIVNTASGAAIKGVPDAAPYNAVKGGVAALTRGMAVDFGKYNIRVNAVLPGMIRTDRWIKNPEFYAHVPSKYTPIGDVADGSDVADAVWYFASAARVTTGAELVVDGGNTVQLYPIISEK